MTRTLSSALAAPLSILPPRHRGVLFDIGCYLLLVGGLTAFLYLGSERLGYHWQWYRVPQYLFTFENGVFSPGLLLKGLGMTLHITWMSLILSFLIGLVTALFRLSSSITANAIAQAYLELIRNTPLLTLILFFYFVVALVFDLSRFASGVIALSLFEGAYASETIRAGIISIQRGQWEAAHSLGLSPMHTYSHVVLPQAVRRIIPPLTSQAVSLVKDSALVMTISVYELSMEASLIVADTFLTFEIWFTVAAMYLVLTTLLSLAAGYLEKRFHVEN